MLGPAEHGLDLVGIKIVPTADATRPLSFFRGFHLSSELREAKAILASKLSGFRLSV